MKINRGNKDISQDVNKENVNVNAVETPAQEPVIEEAKEEIKEEIPAGTKKTDTIVKIQEARKALAEKKAIEEKLQRQDEEAAELKSLLEDMKAGTIKSEKVVKKVRNTMPKTQKAKRVGGAPGGHKLISADNIKKDLQNKRELAQSEEFQEFLNSMKTNRSITKEELKKIKEEVDKHEGLKQALSTRMRHINRIDTIGFYEIPSDDIEIVIKDTVIQITPEITYQDVMDMLQWSFSLIINGRKFISSAVADIIINMAIIKFYTNIQVDEDRLLDDFDILKRSHVIEKVLTKINKEQLSWFKQNLIETYQNYIQYNNSVLGIIDNLSFMAETEEDKTQKLFKDIQDNMPNLEQLAPFIKAYQELGTNPQENK